MSLRKKTLLLTGLTLASAVIILYATSRAILLRSFAELEARHVRQNVARALNAISDDLLSLKQTALDNAEWDETYIFMAGANPDYVKSHFPDETFALIGMNFMLLVDTTDAVVLGRGLDLASNKEIPIPPSLQEHLDRNDLLLLQPFNGRSISGILLLPEGPLLIASNPVLTTASQGPVRGAMVMARYLDTAQVKRLAEITRLSLTIHSLNDSLMYPDLQGLAHQNASLSKDAAILVRPLSADSIAGYAIMKDIYGQPALALRVMMPRGIYQQGQVSISYFIVALLVNGLVFGVVILLVLDKVVISRVARLSAEVSRIGASGDHSLRASISGRDELSRLAVEIDKMLDSLQRSNDKLVQENQERERAERELKRSQQELRNLSAHLELMREEERTRIAREIHDELGQVLSTLKMDLRTLENHFPKNQKILFEITQSMSELISLTIQKVKKISQELRPSVLDHLTFTQAVHWQVDEFMKKTGIPCLLAIKNAEDLRLTRETSDALFRVLQEALTNVFRHAEATDVSVELENAHEHVVLKIQDDGKGITKRQMADPQSFGLIGMRERIHHLNGSIEIKSGISQGTTIVCTIPTNSDKPEPKKTK